MIRGRNSNSLRDIVVPAALLAGDTILTFAGLALGFWLRYKSPLRHWGIAVPGADFTRYLRLLAVGVALLIAAFAQFGLYDGRLVLRRYQSLNAILKGAGFWFLAYLGISLALRFYPPISRLFVVYGFICVVALLALWRTAAYRWLTSGPLLGRLQRRTLLLGRNQQAQGLVREIQGDPAHPFLLIGWAALAGETGAPFAAPGRDVPAGTPPVPPGGIPDILTSADELDALLRQRRVDVLIVTRSDLPQRELRRVVNACERAYVEWKIVPGSFDIFLSGLRLQTIGSIPILGVEELAINRLFSRVAKRLLDLGGAILGLVASAPVLAVVALIIKRESPGGPVFFRQQRVGGGHEAFTLWKLRTMQPGAAATDHEHQSTRQADPRLLRCGAFLRRWNLDELPQFWNVLRGEMSLVGPRPERPHHVDVLAESIPHYLPRHVVKPGMTGWAQVNGLRGDTDLGARIQHDIYYIENWSLWLDVQIMLLTFARWRNPRT